MDHNKSLKKLKRIVRIFQLNSDQKSFKSKLLNKSSFYLTSTYIWLITSKSFLNKMKVSQKNNLLQRAISHILNRYTITNVSISLAGSLKVLVCWYILTTIYCSYSDIYFKTIFVKCCYRLMSTRSAKQLNPLRVELTFVAK